MWYLILLALAYLALNVFLWRSVVRLLKNIHSRLGSKWVIVLYTVIHIFMMTSVASWALFENAAWVATLKYISNVWIGIFVYSMLWTIVAEMVTFILWVTKKMRRGYDGYRKYIVIRGLVVICLIAGFSIYGVCHYKHLEVVEYDVAVDKTSQQRDDLKVVLVADTHIGYSVGNDLIEEMVEDINEQEADLVCIAGDIVDNDYYAIEDAAKIRKTLAGIESTYGVYACYGNHDVEERLIGGFTVSLNEKALVQPQVDDFLEKAGIRVLEDERIVVGEDIVLIGRRDASKPNDESQKRMSIGQLTEGMDPQALVIDIDHQPSQLQAKADAGIDMDLGGHTHDGQVFPGNLTINLFWDNAYGLLKVDDMYSIVTSGVGVWGPAMRVGTNGEIIVVNVHYAQ
ncbi:MAG: metallophosphoesterase family protein [Bacillota bacterium]|nr:metallophosphoesterase family protein [Bacillota bacterium]